MKEIPLTQGKVALVDDEDYEALSAVKWCANRNGGTFYITRHIRRPDGSETKQYLHRLVLSRALNRDLVIGEECDHIDGDGLNNRRENLRVATKAQNASNRRGPACTNQSGRFLGVHWYKRDGKWHAQIMVNYKKIHLGYYATELAAAKAREAYITAHPELNARSNFRDESR